MPPEQLWLDMDRPIQIAPERKSRRVRPAADGRQMELSMVLPAAIIVEPDLLLEPTALEPRLPVQPDQPRRERFGAWLLTQVAKRGSVGDLAKAAKLDRSFPRSGTVDDVRARFGVLGADGDAYEALEDAARQYERLAA